MLPDTQSVEFEVGFYGLRYRGRLDDLIDRSVFFFGSYAPNELDFLALAAKRLGEVRFGVTYFDVGSNVGQHALFMSPRVDNVIAFEPSRSALKRFQANVTLNGIGNVRIFPLGLGDSDGEGRLGSGFPGNSGSRSLTWTLDHDAMETVAICRGDEFLRAMNLPRIDILKLDVEGYEKRVLKGLRQTLARDRPIILMELIGKLEKSGFANEAALRRALYAEHALFTLRGNRQAKLAPFDWNGEAAVCLPRECEGLFSHAIDA